MQKSVRNVDEDLFEEAKRIAQAREMTMGDVINEALRRWINSQEPELSITDLEPVDLGEENLSENYEEELYG